MKKRLIDANKAENALYGFTRYTGIDEAPYEHAETVIDKLPTVEAIPIEWISRYVLLHFAAGEEMYSIEFWKMIDKWRKENEAI